MTKNNVKKTVKKVIKNKKDVVENVPLDYKQMYESMKVLSNNLKSELEYETDLRVQRGEKIRKLEEKIDDANLTCFLWVLCSLIVGILIGFYF